MPRTLAAVCVVLALSACRFTEPEQEQVPLPLWVRTTIPTPGQHPFYDPEGMTLIARFRNDFVPAQVHTNEIVPRPLSRGRVSFDVHRELQIHDVVFDPAVAEYSWLIDGPDAVQAVLVTFHPARRAFETGFVQAFVRREGSLEKAVDALVFVLAFDVPSAFVPRGAARLLNLPIVTVRRVRSAGGAPNFHVGTLAPGGRYVLVAVQDTDDDGRYLPGIDWWGYPHDPEDAQEPLPWLAIHTDEVEFRPGPAAIRLLPPGYQHPPDFPDRFPEHPGPARSALDSPGDEVFTPSPPETP